MTIHAFFWTLKNGLSQTIDSIRTTQSKEVDHKIHKASIEAPPFDRKNCLEDDASNRPCKNSPKKLVQKVSYSETMEKTYLRLIEELSNFS